MFSGAVGLPLDGCDRPLECLGGVVAERVAGGAAVQRVEQGQGQAVVLAQPIGARPPLADPPGGTADAAAEREADDEALLAVFGPAVATGADGHGNEGELLQRHVLEDREQAGRGAGMIRPSPFYRRFGAL